MSVAVVPKSKHQADSFAFVSVSVCAVSMPTSNRQHIHKPTHSLIRILAKHYDHPTHPTPTQPCTPINIQPTKQTNRTQVVKELSSVVDAAGLSTEGVLAVTYQPQAVFKVRAISQCSATIPGHADNIVELYFSPDGKRLATGSGDCTVRFWDIWTQTPKFTCKGCVTLNLDPACQLTLTHTP
jgi:WD40 repeat protein